MTGGAALRPGIICLSQSARKPAQSLGTRLRAGQSCGCRAAGMPLAGEEKRGSPRAVVATDANSIPIGSRELRAGKGLSGCSPPIRPSLLLVNWQVEAHLPA